MSLNRLFDTIEKTRESANWQAAFGTPQKVENKTIIPVAQAGYGFGLGFGSQSMPPEAAGEGEPAPGGEGGGGGGGASSRPLGAIVIEGETVRFEPTMDMSKIALAGIALTAFLVLQIAQTLQAFARRD